MIMSGLLKELRRAVIVLLTAAFIEIYFINGDFWLLYLNKSVKQNICVGLNETELLNWNTDGGTLVSMPDPIILVNDINTEVKTVSIKVDAEGDIPYVDMFYINDEHTVPANENLIKTYGPFKDGKLEVDINEYAEILRIDLADAEGLELNNIDIVINENFFSFSFARFFAIIILYYAAVFLFGLQRSPDYNIFEDGQKENPSGIRKFNIGYIAAAAVIAVLLVPALITMPCLPSSPVIPETTSYNIVRNLGAGYVDTMNVGEDGSITFDGWAYDPENKALVEQIYVVQGKTFLDSSDIEWYKRPAVAEYLEDNTLIKCGFKLTLRGVPESYARGLKFLVKIGKDSYAEIKKSY